MGTITDLARRNIREILNGGFSVELTIKAPTLEAVIINGTTSVHSQSFDSDGLPVIGPNSHCTFSELDLNEAGLVTRDANNDIKMRDWLVTFSDQFGTYQCKIGELMPDRGLGIIVAKLNQVRP